MKKSLFIAVLGLAAGVATSSFGQGSVVFTSYNANGSAGATTSAFGGTLVPAGFTASLYYFIGTISDPVNNTITSGPGSITSPVTGLTPLGNVATYLSGSGLGYFDGPTVQIPGYVSGAITFEVVASGTINGVAYIGRSGSFTMNSIATGASPAPSLGDNGVAFPNFFVAPVPEPTTLALVGLGGLASLVAFRRKQA